jgi:hypothetical protein
MICSTGVSGQETHFIHRKILVKTHCPPFSSSPPHHSPASSAPEYFSGSCRVISRVGTTGKGTHYILKGALNGHHWGTTPWSGPDPLSAFYPSNIHQPIRQKIRLAIDAISLSHFTTLKLLNNPHFLSVFHEFLSPGRKTRTIGTRIGLRFPEMPGRTP